MYGFKCIQLHNKELHKIKLRFLISNKTPLDSPKTTKEKFTWLEIPTWRFIYFIIHRFNQINICIN